jgi:hypothetical protein
MIKWLFGKRRSTRSYHHPRKLFNELCGVHDLDRSSQRLLWQLARAARLAHPAAIFVEPHRFEASQLPDGMQKHAARLDELRQKLFAE